jgi:hypothetical protein
MNEPAWRSLIKHSLWTFVMIMTEIHAVIERHIIFMVRRWQELLITGKRFAYRKGLLLSRSAYAGATLQFLLDRR